MEKVAVVTGTSSGIGFETALALAREGYYTYATMRDTTKSDKIKELAKKENLKIDILKLDVDDENSVKTAIQKILEQKQRIDVLVNNASTGIGEDRVPVMNLDNKEFMKVIKVKLFGAFYITKLVARHMLDSQIDGSIINISSTAGKSGNANMAAYNAANFGLEGFSQALAKELASNNIRVNCVAPGPIQTARLDKLDKNSLKKLQNTIPLKRIGKDYEVADLIYFLASNKSKYISGPVSYTHLTLPTILLV